MTTPTQSTPGGCFIGVTALFPALFAVLGAYGIWKWAGLPVNERHFDSRFWLLASATAGGCLLTLILLAVARRILKSTDFKGYDSRNPDQPNLKW